MMVAHDENEATGNKTSVNVDAWIIWTKPVDS
jgi:hypothetical protein